jgi:hypothetical protein
MGGTGLGSYPVAGLCVLTMLNFKRDWSVRLKSSLVWAAVTVYP